MAEKVLVLGFNTNTSKVAITINRPARGLSPAAISAAMESMIASYALGKNVEGSFESLSDMAYARYVTTDDTVYEF